MLRADGALSVRRALAIAEPILETLQHAHEHGLVHRDVKPDNILIEAGTGRPLLVDFGIVKYAGWRGRSHADRLHRGHAALHESRAGARPARRGRSRRHVRHGRRALPDADRGAAVRGRRLAGDRHPPPAPAGAGRPPSPATACPPWLSAIILRCLAKHPDDRYASARAVLEAICARAGPRAARSRTSAAERPASGSAPLGGRDAHGGDAAGPAPPSGRAPPRAGGARAGGGGAALWASVRPQRSRSWCTTGSPSRSRSRWTTPASPFAAGDSLRVPLRARAAARGALGDGPAGRARTGACWAARSRGASSATTCAARCARSSARAPAAAGVFRRWW